MFYSLEITVPANTAEAAAVETRVKVTHGVITRVSYRPRPGHSGVFRCRVFYHDLQLFPIEREQSLHGDTFPIEWNEYEELFTDPYELVIRAWNTSTKYPHSCDISFVVISEAIAKPDTSLGGMLKKFLSLVGIK